MKTNFLNLMLVVFLMAACGNPNTTTTDNKQTGSEQAAETSVKIPDGTWFDAKTKEVMVFSEKGIFWTNKNDSKFTQMEVKSENTENGKVTIGLVFKNDPKKVYEMIYTETHPNEMTCQSGDKKLNDYKKVSDNIFTQNALHEAGIVDVETDKYVMSENPIRGTWHDAKTGEVMVFGDEIFWSKGKIDKQMVSVGLAEYIPVDEFYSIRVFLRTKPELIYKMIARDENNLECWVGDKKINDYKRISDDDNPKNAFDNVK